MLELKNVNPERLHLFWELIRPGVEICMQSDNTDVRLEDVYTQIKIEKAYLLIGYDDDQYIGFMLIQPGKDPFSSVPYLHIWMLYSIPGKSVLEEGEVQILKLARSFNADKITFMSPRKGFERMLKPMGYELSEILYMKRL